ncbi:Transglutaminase-like enzyme, putative cysteine protease [Roseivivax lentus]|uniref:Transglutaminase-like enzyme, putative cysteine protease n=1 Tax=Roseivivax lentus TaxID=633194 RepID=A0A1N7PIM4_9RHOB|nr:transglutaminase family protein [Roseivivax lentus]SIT10503.1 Transglutaminase-like enzyme, putative cysteine protease [Roseivivax lentus]
MRLTVNHVTRYSFGAPIARLIQSQRLTPSRCANQQVQSWEVRMEGATRGAAFRDGAGDWTETVTVQGPRDHFEIVVEGTVETQDFAGVLQEHREKVPPSAYLTATDLTRPSQGLRELAGRALEGMGAATPLDRAHALSAMVSDTVQYVPGETDQLTPAAEVLEGGKGVCQDQTHVLITLAQLSGIPARYVTGYLFSAAEEHMSEASHAWAELHVPDLGWVGFDASNRCCPDDRYIRLNSGFDAQDAAPIRGVVSGGGGETLDVRVKIRDADDPAAAQAQQ